VDRYLGKVEGLEVWVYQARSSNQQVTDDAAYLKANMTLKDCLGINALLRYECWSIQGEMRAGFRE